MGRLSTAVKTLDSAIEEVVSATLGKNDEEMLRTVKALKSPIQVVISNRPLEDEKAEKLFGISMLDIANSKLQRAKDVAKTAYSISKQCAICTTVVSQRGEEEELLTLHDNFDQDVSTWDSRTRLPCHACKDCFGNFMNFKSSLGRPMLRCPGMNCRCFLDKKRVEAAMPDAFAKFKDAMMRYSLKRVENYRTCPNADCSAGSVLDSCCKSDKVTCASCNWSFCPKCNDVPHEGMTCDEFQQKRHEERWGKAKDYMTNETKQCPYCLVWIEKNGGCNHMTCHHCRGEFCWLCFGEWKPTTLVKIKSQLFAGLSTNYSRIGKTRKRKLSKLAFTLEDTSLLNRTRKKKLGELCLCTIMECITLSLLRFLELNQILKGLSLLKKA